MPRSLTTPLIHSSALWTIERGASPIIATAIHNGHAVRKELENLYALSSDERLREEDPFTEFISRDVPNRIVFHRSRFEVDINRARDGAIYLTPEQAWGLKVWKDGLSSENAHASLRIHDDYYEMLLAFLKGIERRYGRFVVLDLHSYNHRREGPAAAPTAQVEAPHINIGTSSMDRSCWSHVLDILTDHFRSFEIDGRQLDVRENIAFQGKGEQTRFIHQHFPRTGCAIAIEFKKFFMDEWTGEPDLDVLEKLRGIVASAVPLLEQALESGR
ncbi:N-formylglutamate amidohydrolase [Agrobacterium rhizogenes]|nr:N-formylglutamate amidohydrolase [Rhizobium rhizogenes]NTH62095.1 N-formylglutamate amidohydrolase [Rhizobium rhizogenes]NTH93721.1 N-formylglutamate amidohydrolase [Rhizobium rhizogenes]